MPNNKKSKDIVRDGYNKVSHEIRGDSIDSSCYEYISWLDMFTPLLSNGSRILDLGCGNGIPAVKLLLERGFNVTGVDFSTVQIERAKKLVPKAYLICCDMAALDFQPGYFDAIISLHAVTHLPLDQQPILLARIWNWLKPDGFLLFTGGSEKWSETRDEWGDVKGVDMFWSAADQNTYAEILEKLGFKILWTSHEPDGLQGCTLFLAKKSE